MSTAPLAGVYISKPTPISPARVWIVKADGSKFEKIDHTYASRTLIAYAQSLANFLGVPVIDETAYNQAIAFDGPGRSTLPRPDDSYDRSE
jgi:hypothetical protein